MNKGESDVGAPSNITIGDDYEDQRNEADYGYTYEYGEDYDYYDYDQDAKDNSLNERLGLFRSANKGNHLPSKVLSYGSAHTGSFYRILSKGVPRSGCYG